MFGSSRCQPLNIINLLRAVSVIHLLYNISINIGVTANKNMFKNNVQTISFLKCLKSNTLFLSLPSTAPVIQRPVLEPQPMMFYNVLLQISHKTEAFVAKCQIFTIPHFLQAEAGLFSPNLYSNHSYQFPFSNLLFKTTIKV